MIGLVKEDNGLYLLEDANKIRSTKGPFSLSLLSEMFLNLFKKVDIKNLSLWYLQIWKVQACWFFL